jgi:hypothetical protein
MSGRRIDDHSFWAGKGSNGSVFPMGAKSKPESSANSAGELKKYEDTTEAIKAQQNTGVSKAKSHDMRAGYRQ